MSEWITDRLPTKEDAPYLDSIVWAWTRPAVGGDYGVYACYWDEIKPGTPWQPEAPPPPPYEGEMP